MEKSVDLQASSALGAHLQALREARGLSLSRLAAKAGLAKSSLSRLERGDANPTLDTLWRLARELDVAFSALIAPIAKATADIQSYSDTQSASDTQSSPDTPSSFATAASPTGDSGVAVTLVERGTGSPAVDVYLLHLAPGARRDAEAHAPGTEETVQLVAGTASVGPVETPSTLAPGGRLTFDAGQAHRYLAHDDGATLLVTIVYPVRREESRP
ncbi:helix-turn-helix domain-containing protein [Salinicola halophilus]|uniref:helix-turn-helix domain-containing protein n=1 Tax=Salinicola halophilus TaxID=184065 RepID=UPI001EF82581|nr:helix-turn-helix transcriptional regulator [Salinicola halophilus]